MAKEFVANLCCCNIGSCSSEDEDELSPAYLYAFDFDHTIVDQNSDTAVMAILTEPIPDNLVRLYNGANWAEYMEKVFNFVGKSGGTTDAIAVELANLQATCGMEALLQRICRSRITQPDSRFIIVSDANAFFIKTYLDSRVPPLIADAIITNPSETTADGYLKLKPYEDQTHCPLCPRNLCKGNALMRYIEAKGPFTKVYYTGDGANDICPALRLSSNDVVFVRRHFAMDKIIMRGSWKGVPIDICAKIVFWDNASTIEEEMEFGNCKRTINLTSY